MLAELPAWQQGLLGTLFTWFVTALGSAVVFLLPDHWSAAFEARFLDGCLGFAAGTVIWRRAADSRACVVGTGE